jgi:hypothetical protein
MFLMKNGKQFKHEEVFEVLRKKLPEYEISLDSINSRTASCALFLLNSNATSTMYDEESMTSSECTGIQDGDAVAGEEHSLLLNIQSVMRTRTRLEEERYE